MRALVTGATGFTGYNLTKKLLNKGFKVRVIVRDSKKLDYTTRSQLDIIEGDIRDQSIVVNAVKGTDIIYHIAAMYRKAGIEDEVYYDIHVKGTKNLLEASKYSSVERFIHCSTVGVHGDVFNNIAKEDSPFKPGDVYQKSKLEGELYAREYADKNSLALTVIRPTAIYGPGDLRLLKLFKLASMRHTPIIGDGKIRYHMVFIDDLIDGFILAGNSKSAIGEVFIIGGNEIVTLNCLISIIKKSLRVNDNTINLPVFPFRLMGSVCESICRPLGIEPPIYKRRVDFFTKSRSFNVEKANKMLGFSAKVSLEEGIHKTIEWYKHKGLL